MPAAEPVIIAIDQGTTNSKAIAVTAAGAVVAQGAAPVEVRTPGPDRVEQDPEQLWDSVCAAVADCRRTPTGPVQALAISNQRESVVAWDRETGRPFGPVIGWQDTRTAERCARLVAEPGADDLVRSLTGLRIDPMFSAPKISELLRTAGAPVDRIAVGTVDSWLCWRLTGHDHVIEAGNASRTLLFDVDRLMWSHELLGLFGVPESALPAVINSDTRLPTRTELPGIEGRPEIAAVLADSHAALYGQGCTAPGTAKATYGTGSSVMTPVNEFDPEPSPVPTTLAWLTDFPTYGREGNIVSSGAALAWLAPLLGLASVAELLALAGSVPDSGGVSFVPAFGGLGAPHWLRSAEPTFVGLSAGTTREQLARAAVDAVAHQVADVIETIAGEGVSIDQLRVDGGVTASALAMQTQADLLGLEVRVAPVAEVSAVGAARLAWASLGAAEEWREHDQDPAGVFVPAIGADERESRRDRWRAAVGLARR